jgi:hypothetical protein
VVKRRRGRWWGKRSGKWKRESGSEEGKKLKRRRVKTEVRRKGR